MKRVILLAALFLFVTQPAMAADSGGSNSSNSSSPTASASTSPTASASTSATSNSNTKNIDTELSAIRELIKQKSYSKALASLKIADQTFSNNADINNLLGFTSRKLKNYQAAAKYYEKALQIKPNHLGALEYQGELFLLTKRVSDAKSNLAKLKALCGNNCEEYLELKKAIGNK